jgi:hypothetical protein
MSKYLVKIDQCLNLLDLKNGQQQDMQINFPNPFRKNKENNNNNIIYRINKKAVLEDLQLKVQDKNNRLLLKLKSK